MIGAVDGLEVAAVDEHAQDLDGVQRDPLGAVEDLGRHVRRQAGCQAPEQLGHGVGRQRIEMKADVRPQTGTPFGSQLEESGSGQRHDEDRPAGGRADEVLDEVEQAGVRPVEVVEDEDRRARIGDPLEERPPGGKRLFALAGGDRPDADQSLEVGRNPASLGLLRHVLGDAGQETTSGHGGAVALDDAGAVTNHLGQGPERERLAIRRRPGVMPGQELHDTVDVFLDLPADPALAQAGLAEDRHEPGGTLLADGRQEVLHDRDGAVASDERALGQDAAGPRRRAARRPGAPPRREPAGACPGATGRRRARRRSIRGPPGRSPRRRGRSRAGPPPGGATRC